MTGLQDKIDNRTQREGAKDSMNKKIQKILEKEGPVILEFESAAFSIGLSLEATKTKLEAEMDKRCGKLVHFYTSDLIGTSLQLEREETDIEKRILQLQRNNIDPDEEDVLRLNLLRIQIRILDYAMTKKKQYKSKPTSDHMIENTLVHYPFISSSYLSESVLERQRVNGSLIQFRDGYRRMYFKNDMGKLLSIYDESVLAGISLLWKKYGREQELSFDFKELAEAMYIVDPEGSDYNMILTSLNKLYATSFVSEHFLDSGGLVQEGTEYVHLFNRMKLHGKTGRERAATIMLADFLHQNLSDENVVYINMLVFNDFENNASKAMYPFILSLLNQQKEEYKLEMNMLIKQFNIDNTNPTKARQILMKAFEELATAQIISMPQQRKLADLYFVTFKPPERLSLAEPVTPIT